MPGIGRTPALAVSIVENGKVTAYRVKLKVSFKYEHELD